MSRLQQLKANPAVAYTVKVAPPGMHVFTIFAGGPWSAQSVQIIAKDDIEAVRIWRETFGESRSWLPYGVSKQP